MTAPHRVAYVDSSVLVAIAFDEVPAAAQVRKLRTFETVFASPLLEAEVRSACSRERRPFDRQLFDTIAWINPPTSLSAQIDAVLNHGYVRGADCWHLAVALYLSPRPRDCHFLTLDARQRDVAKALGFLV